MVAEKNDIDIFAFVNYASHGDKELNKLGEFNIFTVPDLKDFDGAVVLANSFNTDIEMDYVRETINKCGIPAISVEAKIDGMDFFGVDDYHGMSEVTEHLICEHDVKDILYIGGIKGHEGDSIRMKAVVETAAKHGVIIPEENIIRGNFAAVLAIDALVEWRKHHTLPQAIICANDIMATGICNYLKEERIRIPEEVKVTGFDCLKVAGEYEPSITSVNKDWVSMGQRIMEKLIKKIGGETIESEEMIASNMILGESCGCVLDENGTNTWNSLREKNKEVELTSFRIDQHFRHMFLSLRKVATIEAMSYALSDFQTSESWLEGKNFMMAFCPDFFQYSENNDENKIKWGYPDQMDVACLICNGKRQAYRRSKTSNLIFEAANRNDKPDIYIFVPIRNDAEMFGFAMIGRGFTIAQNDILYIWTKHMSQYLEQVKSNIAIDNLTKQLKALSITDSLTGVYNRAGCETTIYSKIAECQKVGGRSVIMLADIDRLKKINDMYGHGAGDITIKTSIDLLKEFLPDNYMIGRFGGDEFLIAAPVFEEIEIDSFTEELMKKVSTAPITKEYPYKISLSIGGIQLDMGSPFNIRECLKEMDEKMYKSKENHHREDGE